MDIGYKFKHFRDFLNQEVPKIEEGALEKEHRVFFIDTPSYGNIGDQAIALAMRSFVKNVLPNCGQIEVPEDKLPQSIRWIKKIIRKGDIICLTGGGNMGTMYRHYEAVRRNVIQTFKDYPIVIFPQTIDYGKGWISQREFVRAKKVYASCKKLTICARDQHSYDVMKNNFSQNHVLFCPDIVLYLHYPSLRKEHTNHVGLCLREDREKCVSENLSSYIRKLFPDNTPLSTMRIVPEGISWENRQRVVEEVLSEFASNKLVVTDRLHGIIFSYITDTPCIALPNSNGKVKHVCNYLRESGKVVFCNNQEDFDNISFPKGENESLRSKFTELEERLKSFL